MAPPDMPHTWNSTHASWDNGAMDNFYAGEGNTTEPFGHYNGSTVPLYWDLAEQYGLADDFFSADASNSLPNHWDMVAPTPPAESQLRYVGGGLTPPDVTYLNESNHSSSIESSLLNSSVTWKTYDYVLPPYPVAIGAQLGPQTAYDLWNPLAARAQSYQSKISSHFVPRTTIFADAANGTLPNVSWLIPSTVDSDHPNANLTNGEQ